MLISAHAMLASLLAGMPSLTLSDLARMRVQSISFFLLVLLLSAAAVKAIWNGLRKDFPRLPRLTYGRSVAFVGLWGLLFLLVLTMISGARELLTPGAWVKQGATYKLAANDGAAAPRFISDDERRGKLLALKTILWDYARSHDGAFPPDDRNPAIAAAAWETSDPSRAPYIYLPGRGAGVGSDVLAAEPPVFARPRLALRSDGRIEPIDERQLEAVLEAAAAAAAAARRPATAPAALGNAR